jgi:NADPH-dependent 2,4-dienoyl-CoA reductase/sulfur reductase-like enzyme/Fe-S-cluster-containing hydrogenase component 2
MVATALFANGIRVFGHHPSDGAPQGIFCANGQCSQCMVIADGIPVKSCMAAVREGMDVRSCEGIPELKPAERTGDFESTPTRRTDVLIIGGGPSGLTAAAELGALGIDTLVIDDKPELGGKLTLQTHNFFGSRDDCYAGTRGIDIAHILAEEVASHESVETWTSTTAVGIYYDRKVGVLKGDEYVLIEPQALIVAAGAREKGLAFPGCDLPGVYGAGAFQTLANRDRVRPAERLFVVGGGNVGLIAAYHALQAGIEVVGLVEALPQVGGYRVHEDKIKRLGVPVWTSHTVVRADGRDGVERITIAAVDRQFNIIPGTQRTYEVDTLLIAVGLSPINEMLVKAREYGMKAFAAGDSQEIAEASAAIFSGRIVGREVAAELGHEIEIPDEWHATAEVLRAKPGEMKPPPFSEPEELESFPLFRCAQEIPCNPCVDVCPVKQIELTGDSIMNTPAFLGDSCIKCGKCVLICPGLAVSLVIRDDPEKNTVSLMLPWELPLGDLKEGSIVQTVDEDGEPVGEGLVTKIKLGRYADRRYLFTVRVPYEHRLKVAGFRVQPQRAACETGEAATDGETIVCRCSRVTREQIAGEIRAGVRDLNQLKASVRSGMGACGGNTCTELILRLFREEGVDLDEVQMPTPRPLETEVPLGILAGLKKSQAKTNT